MTASRDRARPLLPCLLGTMPFRDQAFYWPFRGLLGATPWHFRGHTLDFVDFDEKNARYSPFEERRTRSRNVISRSGRVRQAVRSFRRAFDSLERRGSRRSGSRECTSGARLREAGRLHPPMRLRTVCHPVSAARPGAAGAASPCRPLSASGPCRAPRPCSGRSAAPCPSRATRAP